MKGCKQNNEHIRKLRRNKVQKLSPQLQDPNVAKHLCLKYLRGCNETMAFAVRCGSLQCIRWKGMSIIHPLHVRNQIFCLGVANEGQTQICFSGKNQFCQCNVQLIPTQRTNWVHRNICLRGRSYINAILSKTVKISSQQLP